MKLSTFFTIALLASLPAEASLPPYFVENQGQWNAPFAFKASIGSAIYYVTTSGMTIDFRQYERQASARSQNLMDEFMDRQEPDPVSVRGHVLKMNFVNANLSPLIYGEDLLSHYSNYFLGRDSCNWRGHVPHYQKVMMQEVWPGIDVELVAQKEGVETVYHVAPYADPSQIQIEVEGLDAPLTVDGNGNLVFATSLGAMTEKAPFAFQRDERTQKSVAVRYEELSGSCYAMSVSEHDRDKELVIDPLLYGGYLGGANGRDWIWDLALDTNGEIVVCGPTQADDFPTTTGAYQEEFDAPGGLFGGFVSRFSANGDSLRFSTYMATESGSTVLWPVGLDSIGRPCVAGRTLASDWPVTPDAVQPVYGGGSQDGIFCRLSADGSTLEYSNYLRGSSVEQVSDLAVDSEGLVYVYGDTGSPDFPVTTDALFPSWIAGREGFLAVFDPTLSVLDYSTFIPGNRTDYANRISLVGSGELWLSGGTNSQDFPVTPNGFQPVLQSEEDGWFTPYDGFLMHWDLHQNQLLYGSYFGWSDQDGIQSVIPLDSDRIVISGGTKSLDFPLTPGAFDTTFDPDPTNWSNAFLAVLSLSDGLLHTTLLSGDAPGDDQMGGMTVGADGIVAVCATSSPDFPVTSDGYDTLLNGEDAWIGRLSLDLTSLEYGTFLGGSAIDRPWEVWFESPDTLWIVGETGSSDFPVTPGAFQSEGGPLGDGFLAKFSLPITDQIGQPHPYVPLAPTVYVYPNPFNSSGTISFSLPHRERAKFQVFDVLGRIVREQDLGWREAGQYQIILDAHDLPSGVYVGHLQAGKERVNQKLVVLK